MSARPTRKGNHPGADKGYDAAEFIQGAARLEGHAACGAEQIKPRRAVPDEIAATGVTASRCKSASASSRALGPEFIGPIRQVMVRGIKKVDQVFAMATAAYNLVRMRSLGQPVWRWREEGRRRRNGLLPGANALETGYIGSASDPPPNGNPTARGS